MIDFGFQLGKFIPCSNVCAVASEGDILTIESDVMWVTKSVADTIAAFARFDALAIAMTDKAVWADAARVAQVGHRRAMMGVLVVLTAALASLLVALFVDRSVCTAIDRAVIFRAPATQIDC